MSLSDGIKSTMARFTEKRSKAQRRARQMLLDLQRQISASVQETLADLEMGSFQSDIDEFDIDASDFFDSGPQEGKKNEFTNMFTEPYWTGMGNEFADKLQTVDQAKIKMDPEKPNEKQK